MDDAKLERLIKPLIKIFDELELELIKEIAIRLNTYDGIKGSLKWYLDKLQEIGGFTQDSLILLAEYAGKSQREVREILKYAGYEVSKMDRYKPFISNETLINHPASLYESVAVQNIINTAIKETNSIMETIQTKALESAKESYMKILTDSYIKVSSGVYSYDQAIKQGLKELAKEGFTSATYKNGKKLSLESTVRRDILTKSHQLAGEVELEKAKELNTNLVYVTQHLGARIRTKYTKEDYEVHFDWQGKVYMLEGSNDKYDNFYEKTGYGELLGLCGVNCRHHFFATKEGWKHPELFDEKENEREYLKQQEQRKYERKIRQLKKEKVVAKQLDDKDDLKSINSKSSKLNKEYTQFLEENNLKRDYGREYIEKDFIRNKENKSKNMLNNPPLLKKNINSENEYDITKTYKKSLNYLPKNITEFLNETQLEITNKNYSYYSRKKDILYLMKDADEFETLHEIGHVLETKLNIFNDEKYNNIQKNELEEINLFNDLEYKEYSNYNQTITMVKNTGKFISDYQRTTIDTDNLGNGRINYEDGSFNFRTLTEYFSEGFRCYFQDNELLKLKDIKLYNYIKEMLENER